MLGKCKTVTVLFYLLIVQLLLSKRTITIFIADDKFVYQTVDTFSFQTFLGKSSRMVSHVNARLEHLFLAFENNCIKLNAYYCTIADVM